MRGKAREGGVPVERERQEKERNSCLAIVIGIVMDSFKRSMDSLDPRGRCENLFLLLVSPTVFEKCMLAHRMTKRLHS